MKIVHLPCGTNSSLKWAPFLASIEPDDSIVWQFDLQLNAPLFSLEDELFFQSLKLALSYFTKEIWPSYAERTSCAILYQGTADFSSRFQWTAQAEENWKVWRAQCRVSDSTHSLRLFCADAFVHYLQMLSQALPDELLMTLLIDGSNCGTPAQTLQLLSQERFENFLVATRNVPFWSGLLWSDHGMAAQKNTSSHAICFPEEMQCNDNILAQIDLLLQEMSLICPDPFRIIQEPFLTEYWEGVEWLHVLSEAVTQRGKRQLMGFCAAGGTVVVEGKPLGLPMEIQLKEFRGRGI